MNRLPNWDVRLAALIESRRNTPFEWGTHDCAMFAMDAVVAVTGRDPGAQWRGSYEDEDGAAMVLDGAPLSLFMAGVMKAFGSEPAEVSMAQRGDFVIVDIGNQEMCGVCLGGSVAAPGIDRLRFVPPRFIRHAWAI